METPISQVGKYFRVYLYNLILVNIFRRDDNVDECIQCVVLFNRIMKPTVQLICRGRIFKHDRTLNIFYLSKCLLAKYQPLPTNNSKRKVESGTHFIEL